MRVLNTVMNYIMLYGRWVIGISRDHHCDQPAPRQHNAPMAGNPLGTHHTELTVEKGRGEGARKMSTNRAGGGQMQGWFLLAVPEVLRPPVGWPIRHQIPISSIGDEFKYLYVGRQAD